MLIKDALVFFFAAGVVAPLARAARLPGVVAFLLAGVALGPNGLGALSSEWSVLTFLTISEPEAAAPFAELGVLFLLFLLGLELSFAKLWALRRAVFGAGALQAGASAALIGLAAYLLGLPPVAAALVGLALALSSTAIVMQLMIEQKRAATPVGRAALSVLLFQDLLVAPILIFAGFAGAQGGAPLSQAILSALIQGAAALAFIVLIGRYVLRRVFRLAAATGGREFLMALTLLTVVGAAAITASAGLSVALGAFLAGLLLGETEFKHQTEVELEPFKGLLMGLFFMSVGMGLDLAVLATLWPQALGGLAALLVVKAVIAGVACRLFAGGTPLSVETAFLLAPAGEFAFVIMAAATASGAVDSETATIAAAIAGLSMLLTPLLGRIGGEIAERLRPQAVDAEDLPSDYTDLKGHVIVAGFGRVGRAIAEILSAEEADIVALDRDAMRVARERERGWKVYYGDAARGEILTKAGAEGASLFIVTVDDPSAAEAMVRAVRAVRSDAPILARAQDTDHARALTAAGARFVIPDAIEAGLQLAREALESFGYGPEAARDRIAAEREAAYKKA